MNIPTVNEILDLKKHSNDKIVISENCEVHYEVKSNNNPKYFFKKLEECKICNKKSSFR